MLRQAVKIGIFKRGNYRDGVRWCVAPQDADVNTIAPAICTADQKCLPGGVEVWAGYDTFAHLTFYLTQQLLWSCMSHKRAFGHNRDIGGGGFDIGNDVRRQNNDSFSGQFGEQVPEANALFGIEPRCRFINDE